jgi:hypothetical protein
MTEEQIKTAMLAGGVEIEASFVKNAEGTETEKVFVRELAVEEYPKLLAALNDERRQVEIFCDKPEGWAKRLRPRSHNEIMQAGEALNKDPFFDWFARRMERARKMTPREIEAFEKKATEMVAEALRNGSLKLPSVAA